MFFPFLKTSLSLHWQSMKKPVLLTCGMAFLLLLFSFALMLAGSFLLGGRGFTPLTLAVADEAENAQIPRILSFLGEMDEIKSYVQLELVTPQEARDMVAEGLASAALVFPEGFLDSVYSGENLSPMLLLDASRPLEVLGLSLLSESACSMLTNAQRGIALAQAVYEHVGPANIDFNRMLWDVNMKYALWFIDRIDLFQSQPVSPVGGVLSVAQHYMLSALLFFCFLAPVGLLYPAYAWRNQRLWLWRIRAAGQALPAYALAQILWGALALFLLLALVLGGLYAAGQWLPMASGASSVPGAALLSSGMDQPALHPMLAGMAAALSPKFSLYLLPALLLISLFIAAFTFVCCNTGHIYAAVSLNFVCASLFLFLSGGLVPAVLLPEGILALRPFSPLTWMRNLLSPLYLPASGLTMATSAAALTMAVALLFALAFLFCRFAEKQGGR